jgi:hypothetical protein
MRRVTGWFPIRAGEGKYPRLETLSHMARLGGGLFGLRLWQRFSCALNEQF